MHDLGLPILFLAIAIYIRTVCIAPRSYRRSMVNFPVLLMLIVVSVLPPIPAPKYIFVCFCIICSALGAILIADLIVRAHRIRRSYRLHWRAP
ncbi:hypothetical protein [Sphingomonas yantingensis]|jgi:uncharacterized membrane protein YoaK (UPF0700 family)|uniref:Uncharacterized membrane protein YoaK (UPF0700 family) n=1 Tax=Sphingomonas yantingensis TaxID=1241761 RepID=A0A7W9ASZ7_9SPHN|nr:hypothetical protein [Sphingomonas yantingensis]MBB5699846.1 uncharacterized membrane protein YoaK (UPF0700 family) [Sphingomonas yantingensis]